MSRKYGFKTGRIKPKTVTAQELGETLEAVEKEVGTLTPPVLVRASEPEEAPLHKEFEWDDELAANEHRLQQARNLINVVVLVEDKAGNSLTQPVPAYVNVVMGVADNGANTREYQGIERAMKDPVQRERILRRCFEKLQRVRREFAALNELDSVWSLIDNLEESIS